MINNTATSDDADTSNNSDEEKEQSIRHSIFNDATEYKETFEEAVARLSALARADYEQCRKAEAQRLKVRVSFLDDEVLRVQRRAKSFEHPNAERNSSMGTSTSGCSKDCSDDGSTPIESCPGEELARNIIEAKDPLSLVESAIQRLGYAGDVTPVVLAYVAVSSRLLDRPLNLQFDAQSASGKNFTVDTALKLHPPEAYYKFSASSPRALIYTTESFKHKMIVIEEIDSIPSEGPAASAIRSIVHDGVMTYDTVERNPESGQSETRRVEKTGPTGLLTTGIGSMDFQMSTRVLSAPLPDGAAQTRAVMRAKAKIAADGDETTDESELKKFLAYQRWLAAKGEKRIMVPFAKALAELVPADQVRMRRDFPQLLTVIKAVAMLAQHHRGRAKDGAVIATLEDYRRAKMLLAALFESVVGDGITNAIRETVNAVSEEVSEAELRGRLNLAKSSVYYRVQRAIEGGWLKNLETRKGHPARLVRGASLPEARSALPSPEEVDARMVELERHSNGCSNSAETIGAEGLRAQSFEYSTGLGDRQAVNKDSEDMEETVI